MDPPGLRLGPEVRHASGHRPSMCCVVSSDGGVLLSCPRCRAGMDRASARSDRHGDATPAPTLPQSAIDLAQLYRAKDMIERDFRLIKDVVELRPIYHHTDPKIRAHITICMLALLLQRLLEARLAAAGIHMTAARCFEQLSRCQLNALERHELLTWMYAITRPQPEHKPLLQALGLKHLVNKRTMAKRLNPRARG